MRKEWLEFLGGLFVFLAALVPVIRTIWRSLRQKLTPRDLLIFFLMLANAALVPVGLIAFFLGWNINIGSGIFTLCMIFQFVFFSIDTSPMHRRDVALFVLSMALLASLTAALFYPDRPRHKVAESAQPAGDTGTPTPSPSN